MAMQVLCTGVALATALMLALELLIWLRLAIPLSLFGFGCVFDVISRRFGHYGYCHLIRSYEINMYKTFGEGQSVEGRVGGIAGNASCPGPETNGVKSGERTHQRLYQTR